MTFRDGVADCGAAVPTICHKCGQPIEFGEPITWFNIMMGAAGSIPSDMRPHHSKCAWPALARPAPPVSPPSWEEAIEAAAEVASKIGREIRIGDVVATAIRALRPPSQPSAGGDASGRATGGERSHPDLDGGYAAFLKRGQD